MLCGVAVSLCCARLVGGGALFAWLLRTPHLETRSVLMLVPAGFLVGFGTVLGSGCTSGHGVCGLGRRSMRSLVAVLIFMFTAAFTVLLASHLPSAAWWSDVVLEGLRFVIGRRE